MLGSSRGGERDKEILTVTQSCVYKLKLALPVFPSVCARQGQVMSLGGAMSLSSALTSARENDLCNQGGLLPRTQIHPSTISIPGHRPDSTRFKKHFSLEKLCPAACSFKKECWLISRMLERLVLHLTSVTRGHTRKAN